LIPARAREFILDDQNLRLLTKLVNDELGAVRAQAASELRRAEKKIASFRAKLQRNCEALESKLLSIEDLAPRIRVLREEI